MLALWLVMLGAFALLFGIFGFVWLKEEQRYRDYEQHIHKDIVAETPTQPWTYEQIQELVHKAQQKGKGNGSRVS